MKKIYWILILGFVLRLITINQSLWLDEAIGALAVKNFSYSGIVTEFLKADNHPPLYYLTLKFWTDIFGYSEISIRFPSVIFGTFTILFTYLIAKKVSNNRYFSLLSAFLISTSQFHIYYSQEARMYSVATFLATTATYSYLFLLEDTKKSIYWLTYSISVTAMMFSDFVPVFLLPVFWLIPLFRKRSKSWWGRFAAWHLPLVILGLFYLPIFLGQIKSGRWLLTNFPGWKDVAGGATFKEAALVFIKFTFGRLTLVNKTLYYSLVTFSSIPVIFALVKGFINRDKHLAIFWLWFISPLALGFISSFIFPAFIYFRFTFVLPAFYLLTAWGVLQIKNRKLSTMVTFWLIFTNFLGVTIYYFNKNTQREDWKSAVAFVEENASESDVVVFEFPDPFAPYLWYSQGKAEAKGVTDSIYATPDKTAQITKDAIREQSGVYYFEYLRELSDPNDAVVSVIKEEGFLEDEVYNFPGVGLVYYYTR